MEITNKTNHPLTIALPAGKKLRLAPRAKGNITPKSAESSAVQKLVEDGTIEITHEGRSGASRSGGGGGAVGSSQRHVPGSSARQSGDK